MCIHQLQTNNATSTTAETTNMMLSRNGEHYNGKVHKQLTTAQCQITCAKITLKNTPKLKQSTNAMMKGQLQTSYRISRKVIVLVTIRRH